MKNYKVYLVLVIALIILVLSYCLFSYLSKYHQNKTNYGVTKFGKKMYCYETYRGPVNEAACVRDAKDTDALKEYYQQMEGGNMTPIFHFPPMEVPTGTFVYVLSSSKNSTIAKIEFPFRFRGRSGMNVCYVYSKTLHSIQRRFIPYKFP